MNRAIPVSSKICAKRVQDRSYEQHVKNLSQMKSQVDNKTPPHFSHLETKAKKQQLQEERYSQIEHDNKILLEKMTHIMHGKSGVDNRQTKKIAGSLNNVHRRRELDRITQENQKLLKRIQEKEPHYNHLAWEKDFQQNQKYKQNILEYKQTPGKKTRTVRRKAVHSEDHFSSSEEVNHEEEGEATSPRENPVQSSAESEVEEETASPAETPVKSSAGGQDEEKAASPAETPVKSPAESEDEKDEKEEAASPTTSVKSSTQNQDEEEEPTSPTGTPAKSPQPTSTPSSPESQRQSNVSPSPSNGNDDSSPQAQKNDTQSHVTHDSDENAPKPASPKENADDEEVKYY
eukprot:GCRY01002287.1.p1 GENE.GCRY01002287.1~~GCRY01002287.1.p1  ORF type:complete len:347 (-),score=42.84 GCRY01002287.1:609-1649(-)